MASTADRSNGRVPQLKIRMNPNLDRDLRREARSQELDVAAYVRRAIRGSIERDSRVRVLEERALLGDAHAVQALRPRGPLPAHTRDL